MMFDQSKKDPEMIRAEVHPLDVVGAGRENLWGECFGEAKEKKTGSRVSKKGGAKEGTATADNLKGIITRRTAPGRGGDQSVK